MTRLISTMIVAFLLGCAVESRRVAGQWPSDHDRIVAAEIREDRGQQDRASLSNQIQTLSEDFRRYRESSDRRMEDLRNDYTSLYNRFVGGGLVLIFLNIGPLVMGLLRKNGNGAGGGGSSNSAAKP